ncbi:MAG: putative immunity protein [Prolixibacteraceae bacterium]
MRDQRFIAAHRGGPLKMEEHQLLINWACRCVEHVVPIFGEPIDERLIHSIWVAKQWESGNATVGEARSASLEAIAVAREATNPGRVALARAIGHAVATAHMADHALVAASYALKALKASGKSTEEERKWQNEQVPPEIRHLLI